MRGYFEDISPDIEYAYRIAGHSWWRTFTRIAVPLAGPGIAAAGLLAFIFCWNNFVFALILASADKQPVTVGALAFVTASGIQYGQIAAAIVLSVDADARARALCAALSGRGPLARRGEGLDHGADRDSRTSVKELQDRQVVLNDVSLAAEPGEIVCVFGPSGVGKTVLLRLIAGVEDPDAGSIMLQGRDVTDAPPETRGVGMAFQNFALFPHMSAYRQYRAAR